MDPITIGAVVGGVTSIWDAIGGFFGGGNEGSWSNGVFTPGDWNNRVSFANQQMNAYGLVASDIDSAKLDAILRAGEWQANTQRYFAQLQQEKNSGGGGSSWSGGWGSGANFLQNSNNILMWVILGLVGLFGLGAMQKKKVRY